MRARPMGAVRAATAAALVAGVAVTGVVFGAGPAGSTPLPACGDGGTPAVVALHDSHFHIDSSSTAQLFSGYAGYAVRAGSSTRSHLYLGLSGFTGNVIALAQHQPAAVPVPDLASGASSAQYFLLTATGTTVSPQTHAITLYDGPPALGRAICSRTFTFSDVVDTIKALANKVQSVTAAPNAESGTIGDAVTVTVTGNTGVLGAGPASDPGVLAYTPNVLGDFPANAWRLERTELVVSPDGSAPPADYVDRLYLSGASGAARDYVAKYVFRAIGPTAARAGVEPIQYIASGTQVKHTDQGSASLYSLPPVSAQAPVSLAKAVVSPGTAVLPSGGGTVTYALTLTNTDSSPQVTDWLTDQMPSDATFVADSLKVDGRAVADPVVDGRTITMVGPFTVPAYGTSTVRYSLQLGSTAGARVNSASAHYADVVLDASADVTVSDPATATVTVLSDSALNLGADEVTTAANTPVTIPVLANDNAPSGLPLTVTAVGSPSTGTALLNDDGTITYNPQSGRSGTASFTYTARDGYTNGTATVTVTVTPTTVRDVYATGKDTPLTAATSVLANDACTSCTVSATLVSGPSLNNQASGTVAMAGNGTFSYAPAAGATGIVTFTYRATDPATGRTADGNVVIYVMDIAPDLAATPNATPVTIPVQANDPGCSGQCHPQAGTAPTRGSVTYSNGSATYTPTGTQWGLDSLTYGLTGNSGSVTGPVTVLVGPPASTLTTTYGVSGQAALPANGSCSGCSYAIASPAAHGTVSVDAATGTATYEPAAGFAGTDSFLYAVRDPASGLRINGTVNVSVGPDAVDDAATVLVGGSVIGNVAANDSCSGTCTYSKLTDPALGALTWNANGTWSYTAGSAVGPVSFTYRVGSSLAPSVTDTATVRIAVGGARDDTATTAAETPVDVNVTGNDPCTGCTLTAVGPASSGTVSLSGGSAHYVPPAGFSGSATFGYTLTQGSATTKATVTVTVTPVGNADAVPAVLGQPVDVLPLANDVAANPQLVGVGDPGSGTASTSGAVVRFTPAEAGDVTFDYQALDGFGSPFAATITVSVSAPPAVSDDVAATDSGTPAVIDVLHNDTCTGCTVDIDADPSHGSVSVDVTNRIVYSATPGFSGRDTFRYSATDPATGAWASADVTVTVRPVALDDVAATNVGTPVDVDVLANDACTGCTVEVGAVSGAATAQQQGGHVVVTPDAGVAGTVTVHYTATDAVTAETAGAVLTVVVSDARPDSTALAPGQDLDGFDVLGNDTCTGCSVTGVTQPADGTASFAGTGVSWSPPGGFAGLAVFTYTAGDGDGHEVSSTVRVLVTPPLRAVTTTVGRAVPVVGVPEQDCAGCVVTITDGTVHGDLDGDGTGAFTYAPEPGWTGVDGFRYRVTDPGSGETVEAAATITVGAEPPPVPGISVTVVEPDPGSRPLAGDRLHWTWTIHNTGDVVLHDPTLRIAPDGDPLCTGSLPATLAVGDTADCATSHDLTQAEIDAGAVSIGVQAVADEPVTATRSSEVSLPRQPELVLTAAAVPTGHDYDAVGDPIGVTYTVANRGNTTLTDLAVTLTDGPELTCDGAVAAPGDEVACTGTHPVSQDDLDAGHWDSAGAATGSGGGQAVGDSATTTTDLHVAPPASDSPSPSASSSQPEPTTSEPQPSTSEPDPSTSDPQPTTSAPQPSTSQPQPTTSAPQPSTSQPQPTTSAPSPTPTPTAPTTPPTPGTGTVHGLVWFDRNGDGSPEDGEWPLPGTTITLTTTGTDRRAVHTAHFAHSDRAARAARAAAPITGTTGPGGTFDFTDVPAGQYALHAAITLDGFTRTYDSDGVADWSVAVTVGADGDAVARFAGIGRGTLAGTVFVEGSQAPVAGAAVTCRWAGYDDRPGTADDVLITARADAQGRFAIRKVPYGDFRCVGADPRTGQRSAAAAVRVRSAVPVIASLPVTSTPSRRRSSPPADTGVPSGSLLTGALLLLVAGAGCAFMGRRRARRH